MITIPNTDFEYFSFYVVIAHRGGIAAIALAPQRYPHGEVFLFSMATNDAGRTAMVAELVPHGLRYTRADARTHGRFAPMRGQIGQYWLEHFIGLLLPDPPPVPWVGQTLANGGRVVAPQVGYRLFVQSPSTYEALVLPETAGLTVSLFALATTLEIVYQPDSIATAAQRQLDECYELLLDHAGGEYRAILRLID